MMRGFLVAVAVLSVVTGVSHAGDIESGLKQSQFVTKQHISAPTGLSVSPQGVAFVSCDPNGLTNDRRGAGRVVRCEDTDGDGRADRFSTFVAGIDAPRGSCYVDDTLYLMQSPCLVAYQDTDGDGVADKKTTLVTNLGPSLASGPVIHGANGVRMGIDGWLYLAIGDQGCFAATGTDGSQATLYGGGVLRVRPDGSRLGVVAIGTRNIYAIAVDPYLDLFARDNTNDGGGWGTRLHHLTELANFGYPRLYRHFSHEAMPSLADYGAGAGTGMCYVHEPGFPGELGDSLYSGDFNTGLWLHPRQRHEATWQVRQQRFMNVPNTIGIDVDGFSRMYAASRQGGGFGFASEPFGHVDLIQPADRAAAAAYPDINKAGDADLLTHLASPSHVTRLNAMREIVTRGSRPTFTTGLRSLAADAQAPLFARVAAIMTLKQLEGVKSHAVLKQLYQDAAVREFVVRALSDVEGEIDGIGKELCLQALRDDNPRVQLRAVVGLARSRDAAVAPAILPLAADQKLIAEEGGGGSQPGADGWSAPHRALGHTALKAVVQLNAVDLLLGKLDDPALREAALRGLQEIHGQRVVAGLKAKVASASDARLAELITMALFRLYHREVPWDGVTWWGNRPNFTGPYFKWAEWEETPAVRAALQASFRKVDPARYDALFRLMRMHQVPDRDLALDIKYDEALALLGRKTLTPMEFNFVMESATDPSRPEPERLQFYEYVARGPLPDSYHNRAFILRKWGEGRADGKLLRQAYAEFCSGKEFIGRFKEWAPFLGDEKRESYKYAHLQLLNLLNEASLDPEAKAFLAKELEKTWSSPKGLHRSPRLRGLILAFEEVDPVPYAEQLKPLVDSMDEHVKQGSARILKAIDKAADPEKKPE